MSEGTPILVQEAILAICHRSETHPASTVYPVRLGTLRRSCAWWAVLVSRER